MATVLGLLVGGVALVGDGSHVTRDAGHRASPAPPTTQEVAAAYGALPLSFEENRGQADPAVRFVSRGSGRSLFLTPTEAVLTLSKPQPETTPGAATETRSSPDVLRIGVDGADPAAAVSGAERLPGVANYFLGNDPSKRHTDVPTYARVVQDQVLPGVDMAWYGNGKELEYDILLAPGADPTDIRIAYQGAKDLSVSPAGELVIDLPSGTLTQRAPVAYQTVAGVRTPVDSAYVLVGSDQIGFSLGAHDPALPLTIDPVISYSTYLGGNNFEDGQDIAVDGTGAAYVTGSTSSPNFPVCTGAGTPPNCSGASFDASFNGGGDAFVTKLNPAGTALLYSTYLGGSSSDEGFGIALDGTGAYVTGRTASTNFPTAGAFQTTNAGNFDAFVTKLNPAGTALLYSTYLGGSGNEAGLGIAVDSTGAANVTGETGSTNFPVCIATGVPVGCPAAAFQTTKAALKDAFVTKLDPAGSALSFSTYLGGAGDDSGLGIALNSADVAIVTGVTGSTNFPITAGAFQATKAVGLDAFVTRVNPFGVALSYSTYLGGNINDSGNGIAVDGSGAAYVTGNTTSTNFPTKGAIAGACVGTCGAGTSNDAFVSKINPIGLGSASLIYSTYLGGSGTDVGRDIAVDGTGAAYVTGDTDSPSFPTVAPVQGANAGGSDAFVSKVNPAGSALSYSTYLGGNNGDSGVGIAVDGIGAAYVTGSGFSTTFPTTAGAFQTTNAGGNDAFVTRIGPGAELSVTKADSPTSVTAGTNLTYTITVANGGPEVAQSVSLSDTLPANTTFVSVTQTSGPAFTCAGGATVTCSIATLAAGASATFDVVVTVSPSATGTISNTATVTSPTDTTPANNSDTETTSVNTSADVFVTKADSPDPVTAGNNLTYTITVGNAGPSAAQSVSLSDTLPANTTFVSVTQTSGPAFTCAGGATVTCSIATLAAGASATFDVVVTVSPSATGTISNTATVTSPTDTTPANNSDTETTSVNTSADVFVTKADSPDPVTAGNNLTYTITVGNAGPSAAQSVSLSDTLPANTTFVSVTQTSGPAFTCAGGATVSCSIATLAAGASATFDVVVTVDPATPPGTVISNTAAVASPSDSTPANNSATATTMVSGLGGGGGGNGNDGDDDGQDDDTDDGHHRRHHKPEVWLVTRAEPRSGRPGDAFRDEALITNNRARGSVTFYLCGPDEVTRRGCPEGRGTQVGPRQRIIGDHLVRSEWVSGKRTAKRGTYCWRAHFSGDRRFRATDHTQHPDECFTVR
jgi:uncharacterized repeat protein (TIGR01451 family)